MGPEQSREGTITEAQMGVMVADLASKLHDMWREPRKITNPVEGQPAYEPRIKEVEGVQFDIANLGYHELPGKFQAENKAAAEGALREMPFLIREFGVERLTSPAAIESLSDTIHKQWMERNGAWAPAEQMVPYQELPEAEKEKDRVVARAAIETYLQENL
ncbi:MAG: hypothetical protein ACO3XO_03545 [Bdellovibrionota bacterium]